MNLERALHALCDAGADFIIIGGVAATFHGSAHVTFDLDIYYSRAASNLKRLKERAGAFSSTPSRISAELPFVWDEATLRSSSVLTLQTDIGNVDLLAEVAGLGPFEEIKASSKIADAFGLRVAVSRHPQFDSGETCGGARERSRPNSRVGKLDGSRREQLIPVLRLRLSIQWGEVSPSNFHIARVTPRATRKRSTRYPVDTPGVEQHEERNRRLRDDGRRGRVVAGSFATPGERPAAGSGKRVALAVKCGGPHSAGWSNTASVLPAVCYYVKPAMNNRPFLRTRARQIAHGRQLSAICCFVLPLRASSACEWRISWRLSSEARPMSLSPWGCRHARNVRHGSAARVTLSPTRLLANCAASAWASRTSCATPGRMGICYLEQGANGRPSKVFYDRERSAISSRHTRV